MTRCKASQTQKLNMGTAKPETTKFCMHSCRTTGLSLEASPVLVTGWDKVMGNSVYEVLATWTGTMRCQWLLGAAHGPWSLSFVTIGTNIRSLNIMCWVFYYYYYFLLLFISTSPIEYLSSSAQYPRIAFSNTLHSNYLYLM